MPIEDPVIIPQLSNEGGSTLVAIAEPPVSISISRRTALETARLLYGALVRRATEVPEVDPTYLVDTARYWENRLRQLMLRSDATVSEETGEAFAYLANVIMNPRLDEDAILAWLDAYPEAIANLFPPSQSTFRLLEGWVAELDEQSAPMRTEAVGAA